jgi:hypothetical protein
MTLTSLLETGQLETLKPDCRHIQCMLDTARALLGTPNCRKRDREIYEGTTVDEESVKVCRQEAARLVAEVEEWIRKHRPKLAA